MSTTWDEIVAEFERIRLDLSWSARALPSGNGINYQRGSNTQLTVYRREVDHPGTFEVAFAAGNLAASTSRNLHDVLLWIDGLQTGVATYAKPKTKYQYQRVAISTAGHLRDLIAALRDFFRLPCSEDLPVAFTPPQDSRVLREIWSRRGQPAFRQQLLRVYQNRCAITECTTTSVLEAAYATPYAEEQEYSRGLLLRADIHTLF